jgi:hypothetical protein
VPQEHRAEFEALLEGKACACVGTVTDVPHLRISGMEGRTIIETPVEKLKQAWKKPFGGLI